ncbi:MAG: amidohydrolase [Rhodothermales bacterium]|nr:amidohydrolase [Rhodothermales bacterium]
MALYPTLLDSPTTFEDFLVATRRHLHQHPEVGFHEHQTYRFIRETLIAHGLAPAGPLATTGLYVDINGALPGPHIGYRADIDALPIQDAKTRPYASQTPGVAHLCGHDVHTTIALGIAIRLHERRDELRGGVRVYFQPNEEGVPSGAPVMIRDGVLDGLEAAYALHVDPTLASGKIGLIKGAMTASSVRFQVEIKGPSTGHSARPHETSDTIWIATQILNVFYQLTGRVSDARDATVLTACRIHAGDAYNVIPDFIEFGGTLRSTSIPTSERIQLQMRTAAEEICARHGATATVNFDEGVPPVINDGRLIDHIERSIARTAGAQTIFHIPRPSMGAEDFAHYQRQLPGAMVRLGSSSSAATSYPLHDSHFDIDESVMPFAIDVLSQVLIDHLNNDPLAR